MFQSNMTIRKSNNKLTIMFILFNISWFGCVFSGKYETGFYVYLIPAIFYLVLRTFVNLTLKLLGAFLLVGLIGLSFDALALHQGWIVSSTLTTALSVPNWLVALWLLFSLSLPTYLNWLEDKWILASVLGFVLGPVSYRYGEALSVLSFTQPIFMLYYGIFWALFFPASLWCCSEAMRLKIY